MATPTERSAERVILVVDDESIVRTIMERALVQSGFRVLVATNGKEALATLESGPARIWLVVSDLVMPVMDGVGLTAAMTERWPAIPVLLVSGSPPLKWEGPFLRKPFTPEQLVTAVEHLLPS
jgi:two-component system cell cycle sensor histidine kinase/response regulator CckA